MELVEFGVEVDSFVVQELGHIKSSLGTINSLFFVCFDTKKPCKFGDPTERLHFRRGRMGGDSEREGGVGSDVDDAQSRIQSSGSGIMPGVVLA